MSKIVNLKGQEIFNQLAGKEWRIAQQCQFLEIAIECRVRALINQIDPKHVTSATVINRRLVVPLNCQKDLEQLKITNTLSFDALDRIQTQLFNQL